MKNFSYLTPNGSKRLNIKAILADPKLRKRLLDGACRFLIAIGRYT